MTKVYWRRGSAVEDKWSNRDGTLTPNGNRLISIYENMEDEDLAPVFPRTTYGKMRIAEIFQHVVNLENHTGLALTEDGKNIYTENGERIILGQRVKLTDGKLYGDFHKIKDLGPPVSSSRVIWFIAESLNDPAEVEAGRQKPPTEEDLRIIRRFYKKDWEEYQALWVEGEPKNVSGKSLTLVKSNFEWTAPGFS